MRSRWFVLAAACFLVLSLGLSMLGLAGAQRSGLAGFDRTTASLLNLALLFVPLVTLTLGGLGIAGELEDAVARHAARAADHARSRRTPASTSGCSRRCRRRSASASGPPASSSAGRAGGNVRAFAGLVGLIAAARRRHARASAPRSRSRSARARASSARRSRSGSLLVYVSDLGTIGLTIARNLASRAGLRAGAAEPGRAGARARHARALRPARRPRTGRRLGLDLLGTGRACRRCSPACSSRWRLSPLAAGYAVFRKAVIP